MSERKEKESRGKREVRKNKRKMKRKGGKNEEEGGSRLGRKKEKGKS